MYDAAGQTRFRQGQPESLFYGAGYGRGAKPTELVPIPGGIAQIARYEFTQPTMALGQDEWLASFLHSFLVSREDCFARCVGIARQTVLLDCQAGADRQPHQVARVWDDAGFIKVVHTPDQTAFPVTPGAEVIHVQVP